MNLLAFFFQAHAEGHNIFYDFLGWFILFYTETTSIIINLVIGVTAVVAIGVSLYFMSVRSGCSLGGVLVRFSVVFGIQLVSLALALGLALLVAVFMDGVNRSLSWFTQMWLIIGLYVLPIIFGMSFLPSLYMERTKKDLLSLGFKVQLFMHSHCVCLVIILFILTGLEIRSACFLMLCVFFDIIALIINLVTKWHRKGLTVVYSQIESFYLISHYLQLTCSPLPSQSARYCPSHTSPTVSRHSS